MDRVVSAFFRAIASQLHPKMLALLLVPFVVAIVFWIIVAILVWDPLIAFLQALFFDGGGAIAWVYEQFARIGIEGLEGVATVSVALLLLVPAMFVTAVVLIAVLSMPAVNRHLGRGPYRNVARRGSWSIAASIWNAGAGTTMFALGYLVTLPLWLIPPLGFIVPWLWWGWFTARVMRFDSLVEHADADERRDLIRRHRGRYLALGLMVTVLNYIPPLFLITPVLSALAFAHFSLALLRDERAARNLPDPSVIEATPR
ncbi:MAG: EI24 domain-containing protein [Burkholderiaceae bacterium]|nr:EI24 domain-containing protein [Burkholderiaceae bacterium]